MDGRERCRCDCGRALKAKKVLEEAANSTLMNKGLEVIANSGWMRKSMPVNIDAEARKSHQDILAASCEEQAPETNLLQAYRNTFVYRTDAIKSADAKPQAILEFYPMLTKKEFFDVEAEMYLGSLEKLINYEKNVRTTWYAVSQLNKKKTVEENFKMYLLPLGDDGVKFVTDTPTSWDSTSEFPDILKISSTNQVILRYQHFKWLEMDGIGEALGYLILLVLAFDFPYGTRPQLLYLLESIYLGDVPSALKTRGLLYLQRLKQLCDSDVSGTDENTDYEEEQEHDGE